MAVDGTRLTSVRAQILLGKTLEPTAELAS